jgi:hypothetical protein
MLCLFTELVPTDGKRKARGDVRKVELNRKGTCTGIEAMSGFAVDDSGEEEGSEGTRGAWLFDVAVVLWPCVARWFALHQLRGPKCWPSLILTVSQCLQQSLAESAAGAGASLEIGRLERCWKLMTCASDRGLEGGVRGRRRVLCRQSRCV